ncbi:MAG: glycosyltransferase family 4 protein [Planctomycetota bacterium]
MKILHLFSNIKLTGPAEPVLNLCSALKDRGHEILFACGKFYEEQISSIEQRAMELGIDAITYFHLRKHFNIADNLRDIPALSQFIAQEKVELVHVHLLNDHIVGGHAAKNAQIPVIRTIHGLGRLWHRIRTSYLARSLADGIITGSNWHDRKARQLFDTHPECIWLIPPAVDTERFNPNRALPDKREELGISESDFVVGIVARIQRHRRFKIFLKAVKTALEKVPNLKALIVGRGTNKDELAVVPARELGIKDSVIFSGYQKGDDFVSILNAMNVKVFLVPGTDETCRAIREAFALGKPVIGAKRGIIPEIIDDGVNGFIVKDNQENIADAIIKLAQDKSLLEKFSSNALTKAQENFNLKNYAERVEQLYWTVLKSTGGENKS